MDYVVGVLDRAEITVYFTHERDEGFISTCSYVLVAFDRMLVQKFPRE